MPGMFRAPSMQLGRIKNPQGFFSSNIGMGVGIGPLAFTPAQIFKGGGVLGLFNEDSDLSTLFQDSAGTIPVVNSGDPVGLILDKSGNANHMLQATSTTRPLYNTNPSRKVFDGVDDALSTATFVAGTLSNNMDCTMLVNLSKNDHTLLGYMSPPATGGYFGDAIPGGGTPCSSGVGLLWSVLVDGIRLSAGVNTTTTGQLSAALTLGNWHVVEFLNLDLSTFTQFSVGGYSGFTLQGGLPSMLLCSAQTDAIRQQVRTYMGRKVGVVL